MASPENEIDNTAELQRQATERGLADAATMLDGDPAMAASVKEQLVGMNGGKDISLKQIDTLVGSGNFVMAEAAKRELKAVNEKYAAEQGKTPEDYDWYMKKAAEHLKSGAETADAAKARLEGEGRKFEAHIMSRFI